MTKKRILAALICAVVFAGVGFVACNEDSAEENIVVKKNATVEEDLLIAKFPKGSDKIELLFNIDSVALYTEREATKAILTNVIVEEISIVDNNPTDMNHKAHLSCASFLSARGVSIRFLAEVVKYEDSETGDILYIAKEPKITGKCVGDNCRGKDDLTACNYRFDEKGNFLGCTMCENEDGKCHSESSPVSSTTANNILSALMNAIKLNLSIGL